MKLYLAVLGVGLCLISCDKKSASVNKETVKVEISDEDYNDLLLFTDPALTRRAQAGELGACVVENLGRPSDGCYGGDSYAIRLQNKNLYYPAISATSKNFKVCESSVGDYLRTALKEGFCYNKGLGVSELNNLALDRRARAGELGNCIVQNVGRPTDGCYGGDSYTIYLQNKNLYYPGMTTNLTDRSLSCEDSIGSYVRTALEEGFCLSK